MPTRDNFLQIIRKWDAETLLGKSENNKPQSIPIRGPYLEQWETIETLAKIKYTPYLNDDIQDFFGKLWSWLEQFDSDDEKRLAFKIASRITFITEEQIRYLQEVCFKEKLLYRILQKSISENKLAPYAYNEAQLGYDAELKKCLIVPLTDSARYNQFVHVNGLENHSQLGVSTLDIFVHPDIRNTPEVVDKLNRRYGNREILIIIEDFCGSGKTLTSDLIRISNLYKFKKIYFCPYIITERAEKIIYRFKRMFLPNIDFEILYGMRLSERQRIFSSSSQLFSYSEKLEIMKLCRKYHDKYFRINRYIGVPRSYPFGYRNGELLVVMQSNCPNHTLPIIWAQDNGWKPLFKRIQRYA